MDSRKKIGFIAGAGLGAAAAVALRRRWSGDDDSPSTVATPSRVADPEGAGEIFLEHLADAIGYETVSRWNSPVDDETFGAFQRFLAATYPLTHARLERETIAGHSLLFTWTGTDPDADPIVLMAHQDVVPIEKGTEDHWEHGPFSGAQDDWYLHGRGALDDKGSLIGILEAVESMLADDLRPPRTIYLAFGHDEEIGGTGAAAIAETLADRGVHALLVLDEGGGVGVDVLPEIDVPVCLIGIGEKGNLNVRITATSEGGHSSTPPLRSPIGQVGAAIAALEDNPLPPRFDAQRGFFEAIGDLMSGPRAMALKRPDLFGAVIERRMSGSPTTNALIRTTTAATMIEGGVKSNVLCQRASAIVNFRIMPGDTVQSVLEHVRSVVGSEVDVAVDETQPATEPSPLADPDSAQFALVGDLARRHCGAEAVAPWILTAATDSRHFQSIADQVLRFVPLTVTPEDFKRFHGTGERIRRSDADGVVAFYRALLESAGDPD